MKNYVEIVDKFAEKHGITLQVIGQPQYKKHFIGDIQMRYVFKLKLTRKGKQYTFLFGQSIESNKTNPTMYDVIVSLQNNEVGSYEYFLSCFGYKPNSDSKKIYKALSCEYENVMRLFGDIIDELREIN